MNDMRLIDIPEVGFVADLLIDLATQVREHCPVLPAEVLRSLAVVDFAIVGIRNGKLKVSNEI